MKWALTLAAPGACLLLSWNAAAQSAPSAAESPVKTPAEPTEQPAAESDKAGAQAQAADKTGEPPAQAQEKTSPSGEPTPQAASSATPPGDGESPEGATAEPKSGAEANPSEQQAESSKQPSRSASKERPKGQRRKQLSSPKTRVQDQEPQLPPATLDRLGYFQDHLYFEMSTGARAISDPEFDPFSDQDALGLFGVGVGHTLFSEEQFSVAAQITLQGASEDAAARGLDSELRLFRLALSPEGRYHFIPRSYVYFRVAPVFERVTARVDDDSNDLSLEQKQTVWGADAGIGAAYAFFAEPSGQRRQGRLWARAEFNGGISSIADLELSPKGGDAPLRAEALDLGELSLSGLGFQLALALTF